MLQKLLSKGIGPTVRGKYHHWDKLIRSEPPSGFNHREWWAAIKLARSTIRRELPLTDAGGQAYGYGLPDPIPERLHEIAMHGGGRIEMPEQITNPESRDRYYVDSLIDEAITSSQMEGAATTRPVAQAMIRNRRRPRDHGEQMIFNNYHAMKEIGRLKNEPLTPETVFQLHAIVTKDTLDVRDGAGRFRREDEPRVVMDEYGEVLHEPPPIEQLPERLAQMCDFANADKPFVPPAIRSIILHFWLAYDHPFVDGNGRTARALFYWSMLRRGYWMFEYISISPIIRRAHAKYGRAFLYTQTDDNDLTYFILYHLEVIRQAVEQLHQHIQEQVDQLRQAEAQLRGMRSLNHRQQSLVIHALRHPHHDYTIEWQRTTHEVVYDTAHRDLMDLRERGLLTARKIGRTWHFTPAKDLVARLREPGLED